MTENLVILGVLDQFSLKFIRDGNLDKLKIGRKLGYLANHDGTVEQDIFSCTQRRYFPELFDAALLNETYDGLRLKYMEIFRRRIDFIFSLMGDERRTFRVSVPLERTSGEFQVHEGRTRFVTVKWEDGAVTEARRAICQNVMSVSGDIVVPDEEK